MNQDISVVDLVLRKNVLDYFLVEVGQSLCTVEFDSTEFGWRDADCRWIFIEPDSDFL